ncbi:hypothetical protein [Tenacibaculum sp. nBUS_03]|uniref:hypothetical protein n=1 Tax=Tenacibaculum sp. nBUS_03 TaxID=3395320 RepID=UPI003EC0AC3E
MNFHKKSKWILFIVVILLVSGIIVYNQVYKPHKTTEDIEAVYSGSVENFIEELQHDFNKWNTKTIELGGTITSVVKNGFILNDFIFCQPRKDIHLTKKQGDKITVKGTIIGYDELLNELKLNQCIIK